VDISYCQHRLVVLVQLPVQQSAGQRKPQNLSEGCKSEADPSQHLQEMAPQSSSMFPLTTNCNNADRNPCQFCSYRHRATTISQQQLPTVPPVPAVPPSH
jgi:hypothetical protein